MDEEELKISNLLIENYKKFKSANIFIKFNKSTSESDAKVTLKYNEIVIQIRDEEYRIETIDFFRINAKSCYNLLVKGCFISFRIITTDDESSFSAEIIMKSLAEGPKFEALKFTPQTNHDTQVACSNCEHPLTAEKAVQFKRILALPSSGMAMDDWFCHLHAGQKVFDTKEEEAGTKMLEPKASDIFYGDFHVRLSARLLDTSRLRQAKNSLHCKRCLQTLGEAAPAPRFWCESLRFNGRLFFRDSGAPVELIRRVLCNHLARHTLSPIAKVIFEATAPSTQRKVHLLLQVMDRSLKVLRLADGSSCKLLESSAVKVMFLQLASGDGDEERTLKFWRSDLNSATFEFSFAYFHAFVEYLAAQSALIPDTYRSNNGFRLSYVEVP